MNSRPYPSGHVVIVGPDEASNLEPASARASGADLPNIRPIATGLLLVPFGARVKAFLIDAALVGFLAASLCMPMLWGGASLGFEDTVVYASMLALTAVVAWIYSAGLEAAPTQGTVGKLFLDARVSTIDGARISFFRASIRFAFKAVSVVLLPISVASTLVAFRFERGQSLHDMVARTIVIHRGARPR